MLQKIKACFQAAASKVSFGSCAVGIAIGYIGHPFIKAACDVAAFLVKHI